MIAINILHMKYAVEVAKHGSLNKASEALLIAQPNLSRSIKELEADLGILIFDRSSRGMALTPEGEEFIDLSKGILDQIDQVERLYKEHPVKKQKFAVSVPRACYISEAFAEFSKSLSEGAFEVFYKEADSQTTIQNICENNYNLGVIRYAENFDRYYKKMLDEKDLAYELVFEFSYHLLMSCDNPLASKEEICVEDLSGLVEVVHADPGLTSMHSPKMKREELSDSIDRRIYIYDRASQFDLLERNPHTYMWVSLVPDETVKRYGLVERKCAGSTKKYKDVLVYRNGYKLSNPDKQFITALCESKRKSKRKSIF